MKEIVKEFLCIGMLTILMPCIITLVVSGTQKKEEMKESGILIEYEEGKKMDLEEFLPYMIAGQISLDVEPEMLKVQAVIARTNLLRETQGKEIIKTDELPVAFLSPETFENSFGEIKKKEVLKKLKKAVSATGLRTIQYEEQYIEALYHFVSTGTTVSAKEIYGQDRPYLQEIDSSQDVESKEYMTVINMEADDLVNQLQKEGKAMNQTSDTILTNLMISDKTEHGYVKQVGIGNEKISGEEWKNIFGLNSTNFYLEEQEGELRIVVLGKGHGVGLSQFGANRLAEEGWQYEDILKKYYPGTKIV